MKNENKLVIDNWESKLDKWIEEFDARDNEIEDKNLFDALQDCIAEHMKVRWLSYFLRKKANKFKSGTNVDALINHALDCYRGMYYASFGYSMDVFDYWTPTQEMDFKALVNHGEIKKADIN